MYFNFFSGDESHRDVESSPLKKLKCISGDTPYQQCQTTTTRQQSIMTTNTMTINLDDANLAEILKKLIAEAGISVDAIYDEDELRENEMIQNMMMEERNGMDSDGWAKVDEKDEEIEELEKKVAELTDAIRQEREDCEQETIEKYEEEIEELEKEIEELQKENEELEHETIDLAWAMRFLDPNGKPCDRCNEPVCYEGNEGKISRKDRKTIICAECDAREADEAKYTTCEDCRRNCYTGGTEYPDGYTCEDCEEDEEASDADTEDDE